MDWARTVRIDAPADDAVQTRIRALFERDGVRVTFGSDSATARTYVLLEGPEGTDPAELEGRFPEGHWYGEAIIALAIEPAPLDALQHLYHALGGPGAPAGICRCEITGAHLLVEMRPSVTQPSLVLRIIEAELARSKGSRHTHLLSPLPIDLMALIAADGLQAPEIASDRILEALLGAARVE